MQAGFAGEDGAKRSAARNPRVTRQGMGENEAPRRGVQIGRPKTGRQMDLSKKDARPRQMPGMLGAPTGAMR